MTLATYCMRKGAERHYSATQHGDGTFSAFEEISHQTPSGNPRRVLTMSDNRKWHTSEEAIDELKKALAQYDEPIAVGSFVSGAAAHPAAGEGPR